MLYSFRKTGMTLEECGADPLDPLFRQRNQVPTTNEPTRASAADQGVRPTSLLSFQKTI